MAEYIEKEAAISICRAHEEHCLDMHDWRGQSESADIGEEIKDIPAADVRENVKSAWVRCDKHIVKCHKCGNFLDMRGVNAGRGDANFCPNCGAKMEVQDG